MEDRWEPTPMAWEPTPILPSPSPSPSVSSLGGDGGSRGGDGGTARQSSPKISSVLRMGSPSPSTITRTDHTTVQQQLQDKRMSATLAAQLAAVAAARRRSSTALDSNGEERQQLQAFLARQWAYTLGAELAHHVVGVFRDPSSAAYRRRWDSEQANRVFPSNPWCLLPDQRFFLPPFFCRQIITSVPASMRTIDQALKTVAHVVTRRNELQHVAAPEDVYMRIKLFKQHRLMKHLLPNDRNLHDFLNCDKLLADWFIGTPRIYRLAGQLLYNARCYLNMSEYVKWADCNYGDANVFLEDMLAQIGEADNKEWYKHTWPTTTEELAKALDQIEKTDEKFGPKLERNWRAPETIVLAYQNCIDSGLLTTAVRRFCSLPCAILDKARSLGLS